MDCGIVSGRYLTIDTCPVPIQCKENNLKTSLRNRFNKIHSPRLDPQAGLGVMIKYLRPFEKKVSYFWGYKNHILSDAASEFPLFELTKPANLSEGKLLISMIKKLKKLQGLVPEAVIGDAAYDSKVKSEVHAPGPKRKTRYCSQVGLGKSTRITRCLTKTHLFA